MTFQTLPNRSSTGSKSYFGFVNVTPYSYGAKVVYGGDFVHGVLADYWDSVHDPNVDYTNGMKVKMSVTHDNSHMSLYTGSSALDTWFTQIQGQHWDWRVNDSAPNGNYVIKVQLELEDGNGTVLTNPIYTLTGVKG